MSYNPQSGELDFEIGAFGDRFKKAIKKGAKALDKVTEATITKPSMMIGGAIGGKKGREWGKKLGGITSMATKIGVGAGVAGAALPLVTSPMGVTAITAGVAGKAGKALLKRSKAKARARAHAKAHTRHRPKKRKSAGFMQKRHCSNVSAANIAALLVNKLGGPLSEANRALRLAELQRTATYEHKKLMSDSEFRKKVLSAITHMAANGDANCQRTIRVLVGR